MKTYMAKAEATTGAKWYLIDAENQVLGRLASKAAVLLMGKHRPEYTPHVDLGDHVIVINSKKVKLTGANKPKQKAYQSYSGYAGGQKSVSLERMMALKPDMVIQEAVRKMLPKNNLARKLFKKLRVYPAAEHSHRAQNPEKIAID